MKHIRHFCDLSDFSSEELRSILRRAASLKADQVAGGTQPLLAGKTLAMLFEKPSTRTRVSFDLAMKQLGGYSLELREDSSQIHRGETIADTARVLSRYVDVIMLRANSHETLTEMAEAATIPVINGLTDHSHPCQIMADILTFEEHRGSIADKKITWVGDGNNVAASFIHAAKLLGFHLHLACPEGFSPNPELLDWAANAGNKGSVNLTTDVTEAAKDAHAVITDTWVSMGDKDRDSRLKALAPYQVTAQLMATAAEDALFLHCLPAHRDEEVTADVIDGAQSVVWDEAENRLHAQKAILLHCLGVSAE